MKSNRFLEQTEFEELADRVDDVLTTLSRLQEFSGTVAFYRRRLCGLEEAADAGETHHAAQHHSDRPKATTGARQAVADSYWVGFIAELWSAHRDLEELADGTRSLLKMMDQQKLPQDLPAVDEKDLVLFDELLEQYKIDPSVLDRVRALLEPGGLQKAYGIASLKEAGEYLARLAKRVGTDIEERLLRLRSHSEYCDALKGMTIEPTSGEARCTITVPDPRTGQLVTVRIDCASPLGVLIIIAGIVAAVTFVTVGIIIIVRFFKELRADNRARRVIRRATCEELGETSTEDALRLLAALLRRRTDNDDERAILRLLQCMGCERVEASIWRAPTGGSRPPTYGEWILANVHGRQLDELIAWLRNECGILDFGSYDDHASRRFIESASCGVLMSLPITDIRRLIVNMFEGTTGNREERAIVSLMRCLICPQIHELLTMPETQFEDFERKIQGAEWRELQRIFEACGVTP
jgi:hypothetical protein